MEEIDHEYTDDITCPYCGYEYDDSWECREDDGEMDCPSCDKTFMYSRNVSVSYSTGKTDGWNRCEGKCARLLDPEWDALELVDGKKICRNCKRLNEYIKELNP